MDISKITPKNDVVFKMILGNPNHTNVLIHFLNCAVKSNSPITSVTILNSELTKNSVMEKGSRLDVKATTQDGELINIEMQVSVNKDMVGRSLFYWSKIFANQLVVNDKYNQLKRTISINILDFDLFDDDKYWHKGHIKDDITLENMTDLLEIQFLELKKIDDIEEENPITFWLEFFRNPYSEKSKKLYTCVQEISEAKEMLEKAKSDPQARMLIEDREKALMDYYNDIAVAKDEGIEIGEKKGREEGEKKGREEGEKKAKIEAALQMKKDGMNVDLIVKYSGLTLEEIKSLKA